MHDIGSQACKNFGIRQALDNGLVLSDNKALFKPKVVNIFDAIQCH